MSFVLFSPNTKMKSAEVNANFQAVLDGSATYSFDKAKVYISASTQTIPHGVETPITFDTEDYDTAGLHSNSVNTSRLTVVRSGYYRVFANILWNNGVAGDSVGSFLVQNATTAGTGTLLAYTIQDATNSFFYQMYTECHLTAADWVEVRAVVNSGSNRDLLGFSPGRTSFGIGLLS